MNDDDDNYDHLLMWIDARLDELLDNPFLYVQSIESLEDQFVVLLEMRDQVTNSHCTLLVDFRLFLKKKFKLDHAPPLSKITQDLDQIVKVLRDFRLTFIN